MIVGSNFAVFQLKEEFVGFGHRPGVPSYETEELRLGVGGIPRGFVLGGRFGGEWERWKGEKR